MQNKLILSIIIFTASVFATEYSDLLVIPKDDAEFFIERMIAEKIIPQDHYNIKPWTRMQVAEALDAVDRKISSDSNTLTPLEKEFFETLKERFARELNLISSKNNPSYKPFYGWSDSSGSNINLNFLLYGKTNLSDSTGSWDNINSLGYGGRIFGTYKNSIGFFVQDKLQGDFSSQNRFSYNFNPSKGEFTITSPETRLDSVKTNKQTFDRYTGYITSNFKGVDVLAGLDSPIWGPAGLMLSGNAPPFTQIRLSAKMGKLQYTYFHGSLKSAADTSTFNNIILLKKYLVGQRLDLILPHNVNLAYQSTLIYGNRSPDLLYMIPITPLFFAQHFNGDQDNVTMGFYLMWNPFVMTEFYGELFLDDLLSPADFLNSYWGNKWAYALGANYWSSMFGLMWKYNLEYTRIEPWVYTHRLGEVTRYRHFGTCLGSDLNPDSDRWKIESSCMLTSNSKVSLSLDRERHGNSSTCGSTITDTEPLSGTEKQFMSGTVEINNTAALEASYRIKEKIMINAGYSYSAIENWQNKPDINHTENRFDLGILLDW